MPIEERYIRYVAKVDEAFDEEENKVLRELVWNRNELRMYKYQKDTFLWRKKYINAFPDAEKNAIEIYTRALMYLWTYANKIGDDSKNADEADK